MNLLDQASLPEQLDALVILLQLWPESKSASVYCYFVCAKINASIWITHAVSPSSWWNFIMIISAQVLKKFCDHCKPQHSKCSSSIQQCHTFWICHFLLVKIKPSQQSLVLLSPHSIQLPDCWSRLLAELVLHHPSGPTEAITVRAGLKLLDAQVFYRMDNWISCGEVTK